MVKLHFGANLNLLEGWQNFRNENECDLRKRLPYHDCSVDFIMSDHVIEHLSSQHGYLYLTECHRVLKPGGVVRTTFPDIARIWERSEDEDYLQFVTDQAPQWWKAAGMTYHGGKATRQDVMTTIIMCHAHKGLFTADLLMTFCKAVGLIPEIAEYGQSRFPELVGVEQHWRQLGLHRAELESVCVDAQKPE